MYYPATQSRKTMRKAITTVNAQRPHCSYFLWFEKIDGYKLITPSFYIKAKTEVFNFFKIFQIMATAHFNMKISRIRCDNGRVYISKEIKEIFEAMGIQFKFTIRYNSEQTVVAERNSGKETTAVSNWKYAFVLVPYIDEYHRKGSICTL